MPKFHTLKIKDIRRETQDCVSVAFDVPNKIAGEFQFLPGQHLTLRKHIGGEEIRRTYSICSGPSEDDLRVAIKKVEGGRFSTFANEGLTPGEDLEVMTPMGNFTVPLHSENEKYYVAFAAGSGITPVISLMRTILAEEPKSFFTLFYGNKGSRSIIFLEEIEALKNQYLGRLSVHHVLSREHPGNELFYGRIDEQKCNFFLDNLVSVEDIDEVFLCGPDPMIRTVKKALEARGVDKKKVHFELFTTPGQVLNIATKKVKKEQPRIVSKLSVTLDGKTNSFDLQSTGETILDAATRFGLDLPYACKGGVCCTCKAKVLEGEVDMEVNYALEEDQVADGYILTCQAHPLSDRVVVSFDE